MILSYYSPKYIKALPAAYSTGVGSMSQFAIEKHKMGGHEWDPRQAHRPHLDEMLYVESHTVGPWTERHREKSIIVHASEGLIIPLSRDHDLGTKDRKYWLCRWTTMTSATSFNSLVKLVRGIISKISSLFAAGCSSFGQ